MASSTLQETKLMKTAYFNRFNLDLPDQCVLDCSRIGSCDDDVSLWATRVTRIISSEAIKAELQEYGAWEDDELNDDEQNWKRIIWIAAGDIKEEEATKED
jgi:hypothetical protein